jgi:hypothetical protein
MCGGANSIHVHMCSLILRQTISSQEFVHTNTCHCSICCYLQSLRTAGYASSIHDIAPSSTVSDRIGNISSAAVTASSSAGISTATLSSGALHSDAAISSSSAVHAHSGAAAAGDAAAATASTDAASASSLVGSAGQSQPQSQLKQPPLQLLWGLQQHEGELTPLLFWHTLWTTVAH